jgi:S1-C subfamily serine protease
MTALFPPPLAPTPVASAPPAEAPRPRGARRFLAGVALGAAVGALVAGTIVAVAADDDPPPIAAHAALTTSSAAGASTRSANPIHDLAVAAEPAIVSIHDSVAQTDMFGRQVEGQAAGTGFVLDPAGYIATNNHVIDGATDISVRFSNGDQVAAKVVAADPASDLAVLKVDRKGLTALPLGDSDALQVGDQVVAIGNALDLSGGPTVTTGIVSAKDRSLTEPNGEHLGNLLQTDTAINPGNSGGPLLDLQGRVVGINTAIAGQAQNIGFAIAIGPARDEIQQLQAGRVPAHALLGVSTQSPAQGDGPGAEVTEVQPGSAAAAAGIKAGDIITAIDGAAIAVPDDLAAAISSHEPDDKVDVTYTRDGHQHDVTVALGTRSPNGE